MSFYSNDPYPKKYGNNTYPVLSNKTSNLLTRIEPILTPEKLISRYLKGINLSDYSVEELKDKIHLALNEAEILLDTTLTPVRRKEKHPFDYNLYKSFIHINANFGPVLQVDRLSIQSSNDINIFEIPADWIEAARFSKTNKCYTINGCRRYRHFLRPAYGCRRTCVYSSYERGY